MRLSIPLFVLLFFTINIKPQTIEPKIITSPYKKSFVYQYDKFRNQTTVFLIIPQTSKLTNLKSYAGIAFIGHTPVNLTYFFRFESTSSDWMFLRNHSLFLLPSAKRHIFEDGKYDGKIRKTPSYLKRVILDEVTTFITKRDVFEDLTKNTTVPFRYGDVEGSFNNTDRLFTELLSFVTPQLKIE